MVLREGAKVKELRVQDIKLHPLNKSQQEAVKMALKTNFSVIQGPPGEFRVYIIYYSTVRPRLSDHVGTVTYPDKRFVRIWELCLNTASSVGFIQVTMHLLIATVFVTNDHS